MTKNDTLAENEEKLSHRQKKSIPYLVSSPTYEEGCRKARISRNTLYEWLKFPAFREELKKERRVVIGESLEVLKQNVTKAIDTLVNLLATADSDSLKRLICNDIIGHTLKAREVEDLEKRLTELEKKVFR